MMIAENRAICFGAIGIRNPRSQRQISRLGNFSDHLRQADTVTPATISGFDVQLRRQDVRRDGPRMTSRSFHLHRHHRSRTQRAGRLMDQVFPTEVRECPYSGKGADRRSMARGIDHPCIEEVCGHMATTLIAPTWTPWIKEFKPILATTVSDQWDAVRTQNWAIRWRRNDQASRCIHEFRSYFQSYLDFETLAESCECAASFKL